MFVNNSIIEIYYPNDGDDATMERAYINASPILRLIKIIGYIS